MKRIAMPLSIALLSCVLFFNSCNKSDSTTTGNTTVAEDKTFLTNTTTNTSNCIKAARDGNLSQSIIQFLNLQNGTAGNQDWADSMSNALDNVMGSLDLDPNNSKFNFSSYWGTYTYVKATKTFTKTAATGIFINFPSTPAQATNNVSIKFTEYTDGLYQANAKSIYLPKTAKATMTKDGVEIASMNLSASYASGSFPEPVNVSYALYLAPDNYNFKIQQVNSTQYTFASNIFSGGGCGISLNATVTFNNDDYNNFDVEDDLKTVTAQYQSGDMIIKTNWDAKAYYAISNPTTTTLNATLTNSVYNLSNKIADLKFVDVSGQRKMFIYYKDGSSENTSIYYEPFLTNLKNILRPMFGNDVDNWF